MRQVFSVLTSLQGPQLLFFAGVTYLCEGVTATSIVVLSFILLFLQLFYRFRNVSVRKCLMAQLAKFLM